MDDLAANLERDIFEMFLFPCTLSCHLHTIKWTSRGWEVLLEVRADAGMVHLYSSLAFPKLWSGGFVCLMENSRLGALKTRRFWSGIILGLILGLSCSHFTLIMLTVRKHRKQWHTKFNVGLGFFSNNFVLLTRLWLAKTRLVFVLVRFLWAPEELSRQLMRKANNHMYLLWCFKFQGRGLDASRPLTWV